MFFSKLHGQPHVVSSDLSEQSLAKSHFLDKSMQPEPLAHLKHVGEVGVALGVGRPVGDAKTMLFFFLRKNEL